MTLLRLTRGLAVAFSELTSLALAAPSITSAESGPGTLSSNLSNNTVLGDESVTFVATNTGDGDSATANSAADFVILPGYLQLIAVPDLNFGNVTSKTVINGGSQALVNNSVVPGPVKGASGHDGNKDGLLTVSDFRGKSGGWRLTLGLSGDFKAQDESLVRDVSLTINPTTSSNSFGAQSFSLSASDVGKTAQEISATPETGGAGDTQYRLNQEGAARLTFPKNTNANFSNNTNYQTDLVWTLIAAD